MRYLLPAIVLALASSVADAQVFPRRGQSFAPQSCPGGVCPASGGFAALQAGTAYSLSGAVYADPGAAPSANHELHLQGNKLVWVPRSASAPQAMERPRVPAPKFAAEPSTARDSHGRLFYRVVKDRAYGQLVDRGVQPAKARKLVDTLSHESIDTYADHVGVSQGIGDGKILDWLIDHREEILALIKLIVSLLAVV